MLVKRHQYYKPHRRHTMPPLRTWQRLVVGGVLIVATALSIALIYFQPGTRTLIDLDTTPSAAPPQTAPALPPGTDSYYFWGQWKPLDQQP